MSFPIEDYPLEVEGHPSSSPFTLKVRPVSKEGRPLRGALVKYLSPEDLSTSADAFSGSGLATFDAQGGDVPRGFVVVEHYGRRVASALVEEGDALTQTGTRQYTLEVKGGMSSAPESFDGLDAAVWVGGELVCTWRPPRNSAPGAYNISGARSGQEEDLFTTNHEGIDSQGHPSVFKEISIPASGAPINDGEWHKNWLLFWVYDYNYDKQAISALRKGEASYVQIPSSEFTENNGLTLWSQTQRQGKGRYSENRLSVPAYDPNPNYDTGSNVSGVTISPDPETVVEGDAYILTANVSGDGNHDPTVTWSSNGPTIVTKGATECLVEADRSGTVTATSNGDSSYSDSITLDVVEYPADTVPSAPSGISWRSARPPGTATISWDDTAGKLSHYRLYLAESKSERDVSPRVDTYRSQVRVGDLSTGTTYHAGLVAVHPDGNESTMETFTVTPENIAGEKAGRRTVPPREQKIAPGESRTVDLADHVHLTPTATASDQSTLWSNASVSVHRASDSSPISVSVSGSEVTFSADGGASTDHGNEPVLIKIENGDRVPLWIGMLATVASSTAAGPQQMTDIPAEKASSFDTEALVGDNASTIDLSQWAPKIERHAHLAGLWVDEEGNATFDPGDKRDGVPAVAALEGSAGAALIVATRDRSRASRSHSSPQRASRR